MWVPRMPLRFDFCGCPPCPLCFDWTGGEPVAPWVTVIFQQPIVTTESEPRIDGMAKFVSDILEGREPTAEELATLKKAAEAVHVGNLNSAKRIDQELRELDQAQHLQRKITALANDTRAAANVVKPLNTVTLDGKDLSFVEKEVAERIAADKAAARAATINPLYGYSEPTPEEVNAARRYFFSMSVGNVVPPGVIVETPKLTEVDIRRRQAEEDAKRRMRIEAREPVRR